MLNTTCPLPASPLSAVTRQELSANEQLLAGIVSSAMDAIITIDEQHRIVLFNPAAEAMFRCRAEDALGQPLTIFLPQRFHDTHAQKINAFAGSAGATRKMGLHNKVVGRRFDGDEFPIEASIAKMNVEGRIFFTVILRDTTERYQAEAALRASETQIRELADAMPQMVFVINKQGAFEYLNQHARETLGGIPVSRWWTILPPDDRRRLLQEWQSSIQTNKPFQLLHRIQHHGTGPERWFLSRAVPVRDATGEIQHWYGTATDIHEQKLVEGELDRTTKLLHAVLHGANEGIFVKDLEGRYVLANSALGVFLGQPTDLILGNDDRALLSAGDAERIIARDADILLSKKAKVYESQMMTSNGVKSYLATKSPLFSEDGTVVGLIGIVHDITTRKAAEEAFRDNERRLQMALAAAQMGVWEWHQVTRTFYWSPESYEIFGNKEPIDTLEDFLDFVHPDDRERLRQTVTSAVTHCESYAVEFRWVRTTGEIRWLVVRGQMIIHAEERLQRVIGTIQDITERVRLEEQLRQSQKMEAVGQLAGGIAHDFNNLLTVINGYSNLLLAKWNSDDKNSHYLQSIHDAGERAAALTRQLLAFSRKQLLEPKLVNLHTVINGIDSMLRRLIGEDIALITLLSATQPYVKVDPHQFEQVAVNLAVNARDAMRYGGKLTIETRNVVLDERYCRLHADVKPGTYLRIAVTDTGEGMAPEIKERIFEPFFTTKGPGKGTGLGLATVFGIVKQSEGHINVYSEVGAGTCFKIYLPLARQLMAESPVRYAPETSYGSETVLLVEDDRAVRSISQLALEEYGYHVITAHSGAQAIQLIDESQIAVDLLITDVVMPQMDGVALAERLHEVRPALKTLFMSGYTDDAVIRHNILHKDCFFINKPFSPETLARKVRSVLDDVQSPAPLRNST